MQLRYFAQPEDTEGSAVPYGDNLPHGSRIKAGDAQIYYEVYGEGRPLFVFHGGGVGSPYELSALIDQFRKDFKVIVVSARGHGRSEIGRTPLTYKQKAEDMLAVMREVTDEPAVLFGFSDGAYTAYKVAATAPERVERIIAIGAGTLKPGHFKPELPVEALEQMDKAYVDQMRRLMPEPERLQEFLTAYMTFWSRMRIGRELFGAIRCPVLLLAGDEDDHAPIASMVQAHQMIPNSRLCIVPKAWHPAFLDNFPVTWAAIREFLYADPASLVPAKKLPQNDIGD